MHTHRKPANTVKKWRNGDGAQFRSLLAISRLQMNGRLLKNVESKGARNERHPVNGANGEASEQIKCASRSAMRERRSGFDNANCGQQGAFAEQRPLPPAARSRKKNVLTAAGRPKKQDIYTFPTLARDTEMHRLCDINHLKPILERHAPETGYSLQMLEWGFAHRRS